MTKIKQNSIQLKAISLFIALSFLITSLKPVPAFAASSPSVSAPHVKFPENPQEVQVPESLGSVQDSYRGDSNRTVILIQDAHSVPDAQKNIQALISHFQKQYGISVVGLEGAASPLDAQILKSFPDQELLHRILDEYTGKGELSGGAAAAVLNKNLSRYFGVENLALYEEGLALYEAALENESFLRVKNERLRRGLENLKKEVYSPRLYEVDQALRAFSTNAENFEDVLRALNAVMPPEKGSALDDLVRETLKSSGPGLENEVRNWVREVEAASNQLSAEEQKVFNEKLQRFHTSQVPAEAFALELKETVERYDLKVALPESLRSAVARQKRLKDLEGTRVFKEFDAYAHKVKERLFSSREERKLDRQSRALELLEKATRLELGREDWSSLKKIKRAGVRELYSAHYAFYENAEKRDAAFLENLKRSMAVGESSEAVLVSGGFHTEDLKAQLQKEKISYLAVMPAIGNIPDESVYRAQMRGDVSWKKYLEPEKGKLSVSAGFIRALRDRLLEASGNPESLKTWRDQIIRDLAAEERTGDAGLYLRFLDEKIQKESANSFTASWKDNIEKFLEKIRNLDESGELNIPAVRNLLKPANIVPKAAGPAIFSSDVFSASVRSEFRASNEIIRSWTNLAWGTVGIPRNSKDIIGIISQTAMAKRLVEMAGSASRILAVGDGDLLVSLDLRSELEPRQLYPITVIEPALDPGEIRNIQQPEFTVITRPVEEVTMREVKQPQTLVYALYSFEYTDRIKTLETLKALSAPEAKFLFGFHIKNSVIDISRQYQLDDFKQSMRFLKLTQDLFEGKTRLEKYELQSREYLDLMTEPAKQLSMDLGVRAKVAVSRSPYLQGLEVSKLKRQVGGALTEMYREYWRYVSRYAPFENKTDGEHFLREAGKALEKTPDQIDSLVSHLEQVFTSGEEAREFLVRNGFEVDGIKTVDIQDAPGLLMVEFHRSEVRSPVAGDFEKIGAALSELSALPSPRERSDWERIWEAAKKIEQLLKSRNPDWKKFNVMGYRDGGLWGLDYGIDRLLLVQKSAWPGEVFKLELREKKYEGPDEREEAIQGGSVEDFTDKLNGLIRKELAIEPGQESPFSLTAEGSQIRFKLSLRKQAQNQPEAIPDLLADPENSAVFSGLFFASLLFAKSDLTAAAQWRQEAKVKSRNIFAALLLSGAVVFAGGVAIGYWFFASRATVPPVVALPQSDPAVSFSDDFGDADLVKFDSPVRVLMPPFFEPMPFKHDPSSGFQVTTHFGMPPVDITLLREDGQPLGDMNEFKFALWNEAMAPNPAEDYEQEPPMIITFTYQDTQRPGQFEKFSHSFPVPRGPRLIKIDLTRETKRPGPLHSVQIHFPPGPREPQGGRVFNFRIQKGLTYLKRSELRKEIFDALDSPNGGKFEITADDGSVFEFRLSIEDVITFKRYRLRVFRKTQQGEREIGFAHARFYRDRVEMQESFSFLFAPEDGIASAISEALYVYESVRAQYRGIGRSMMAILMGLAQRQGLQSFTLQNVVPQAEGFYRELGFKALVHSAESVVNYRREIKSEDILPDIVIEKKKETRSETRMVSGGKRTVTIEAEHQINIQIPETGINFIITYINKAQSFEGVILSAYMPKTYRAIRMLKGRSRRHNLGNGPGAISLPDGGQIEFKNVEQKDVDSLNIYMKPVSSSDKQVSIEIQSPAPFLVEFLDARLRGEKIRLANGDLAAVDPARLRYSWGDFSQLFDYRNQVGYVRNARTGIFEEGSKKPKTAQEADSTAIKEILKSIGEIGRELQASMAPARDETFDSRIISYRQTGLAVAEALDSGQADDLEAAGEIWGKLTAALAKESSLKEILRKAQGIERKIKALPRSEIRSQTLPNPDERNWKPEFKKFFEDHNFKPQSAVYLASGKDTETLGLMIETFPELKTFYLVDPSYSEFAEISLGVAIDWLNYGRFEIENYFDYDHFFRWAETLKGRQRLSLFVRDSETGKRIEIVLVPEKFEDFSGQADVSIVKNAGWGGDLAHETAFWNKVLESTAEQGRVLVSQAAMYDGAEPESVVAVRKEQLIPEVRIYKESWMTPNPDPWSAVSGYEWAVFKKQAVPRSEVRAIPVTVEQITTAINEVARRSPSKEFTDQTKARLVDKINAFKFRAGDSALVVGPGSYDYLPIVLSKLGVRATVIEPNREIRMSQVELHRAFGLDREIAAFETYAELRGKHYDHIFVLGVMNVILRSVEYQMYLALAPAAVYPYLTQKIRDMFVSILPSISPSGSFVIVNDITEGLLWAYQSAIPMIEERTGLRFNSVPHIDVNYFSLHESYLNEPREGVVFFVSPRPEAPKALESAEGRSELRAIDTALEQILVREYPKTSKSKTNTAVLEVDGLETDPDLKNIRAVIVRSRMPSPYGEDEDQYYLFVFDRDSGELGAKASLVYREKDGDWEVLAPDLKSVIPGKGYMQRGIRLLLKTGAIQRWYSANYRSPDARKMYEAIGQSGDFSVREVPGYGDDILALVTLGYGAKTSGEFVRRSESRIDKRYEKIGPLMKSLERARAMLAAWDLERSLIFDRVKDLFWQGRFQPAFLLLDDLDYYLRTQWEDHSLGVMGRSEEILSLIAFSSAVVRSFARSELRNNETVESNVLEGKPWLDWVRNRFNPDNGLELLGFIRTLLVEDREREDIIADIPDFTLDDYLKNFKRADLRLPVQGFPNQASRNKIIREFEKKWKQNNLEERYGPLAFWISRLLDSSIGDVYISRMAVYSRELEEPLRSEVLFYDMVGLISHMRGIGYHTDRVEGLPTPGVRDSDLKQPGYYFTDYDFLLGHLVIFMETFVRNQQDYARTPSKIPGVSLRMLYLLLIASALHELKVDDKPDPVLLTALENLRLKNGDSLFPTVLSILEEIRDFSRDGKWEAAGLKNPWESGQSNLTWMSDVVLRHLAGTEAAGAPRMNPASIREISEKSFLKNGQVYGEISLGPPYTAMLDNAIADGLTRQSRSEVRSFQPIDRRYGVRLDSNVYVYNDPGVLAVLNVALQERQTGLTVVYAGAEEYRKTADAFYKAGYENVVYPQAEGQVVFINGRALAAVSEMERKILLLSAAFYASLGILSEQEQNHIIEYTQNLFQGFINAARQNQMTVDAVIPTMQLASSMVVPHLLSTGAVKEAEFARKGGELISRVVPSWTERYNRFVRDWDQKKPFVDLQNENLADALAAKGVTEIQLEGQTQPMALDSEIARQTLKQIQELMRDGRMKFDITVMGTHAAITQTRSEARAEKGTVATLIEAGEVIRRHVTGEGDEKKFFKVAFRRKDNVLFNSYPLAGYNMRVYAMVNDLSDKMRDGMIFPVDWEIKDDILLFKSSAAGLGFTIEPLAPELLTQLPSMKMGERVMAVARARGLQTQSDLIRAVKTATDDSISRSAMAVLLQRDILPAREAIKRYFNISKTLKVDPFLLIFGRDFSPELLEGKSVHEKIRLLRIRKGWYEKDFAEQLQKTGASMDIKVFSSENEDTWRSIVKTWEAESVPDESLHPVLIKVLGYEELFYPKVMVEGAAEMMEKAQAGDKVFLESGDRLLSALEAWMSKHDPNQYKYLAVWVSRQLEAASEAYRAKIRPTQVRKRFSDDEFILWQRLVNRLNPYVPKKPKASSELRADQSAHYRHLTVVMQRLESKWGISPEELLSGKIADIGLETDRGHISAIEQIMPENLVTELRRQGKDIIGIDPDAPDEPAGYYLKATAQQMPLEDASMDLVVSVGLFDPSFWYSAVESPVSGYMEAVAEIKRVLKPGGRALIIPYGPMDSTLYNSFKLGGFKILPIDEKLGQYLFIAPSRSEVRSGAPALDGRGQPLGKAQVEVLKKYKVDWFLDIIGNGDTSNKNEEYLFDANFPWFKNIPGLEKKSYRAMAPVMWKTVMDQARTAGDLSAVEELQKWADRPAAILHSNLIQDPSTGRTGILLAPSGVGKSTLSAYLSELPAGRAFRILADDDENTYVMLGQNGLPIAVGNLLPESVVSAYRHLSEGPKAGYQLPVLENDDVSPVDFLIFLDPERELGTVEETRGFSDDALQAIADDAFVSVKGMKRDEVLKAFAEIPALILGRKISDGYDRVKSDDDTFSRDAKSVVKWLAKFPSRSEVRSGGTHWAMLDDWMNLAATKINFSRREFLKGKILDVGLETEIFPLLGAVAKDNLVTQLRPRGVDIVGLDPQAPDDPENGMYRGQAQAMPFADGTFDAVVSVGLFDPAFWEIKNTTNDYFKVASEMFRVLKSGGSVYLNAYGRIAPEFINDLHAVGFRSIPVSEGFGDYYFVRYDSPGEAVMAEVRFSWEDSPKQMANKISEAVRKVYPKIAMDTHLSPLIMFYNSEIWDFHDTVSADLRDRQSIVSALDTIIASYNRKTRSEARAMKIGDLTPEPRKTRDDFDSTLAVSVDNKLLIVQPEWMMLLLLLFHVSRNQAMWSELEKITDPSQAFSPNQAGFLSELASYIKAIKSESDAATWVPQLPQDASRLKMTDEAAKLIMRIIKVLPELMRGQEKEDLKKAISDLNLTEEKVYQYLETQGRFEWIRVPYYMLKYPDRLRESLNHEFHHGKVRNATADEKRTMFTAYAKLVKFHIFPLVEAAFYTYINQTVYRGNFVTENLKDRYWEEFWVQLAWPSDGRLAAYLNFATLFSSLAVDPQMLSAMVINERFKKEAEQDAAPLFAKAAALDANQLFPAVRSETRTQLQTSPFGPDWYWAKVTMTDELGAHLLTATKLSEAVRKYAPDTQIRLLRGDGVGIDLSDIGTILIPISEGDGNFLIGAKGPKEIEALSAVKGILDPKSRAEFLAILKQKMAEGASRFNPRAPMTVADVQRAVIARLAQLRRLPVGVTAKDVKVISGPDASGDYIVQVPGHFGSRFNPGSNRSEARVEEVKNILEDKPLEGWLDIGLFLKNRQIESDGINTVYQIVSQNREVKPGEYSEWKAYFTRENSPIRLLIVQAPQPEGSSAPYLTYVFALQDKKAVHVVLPRTSLSQLIRAYSLRSGEIRLVRYGVYASPWEEKTSEADWALDVVSITPESLRKGLPYERVAASVSFSKIKQSTFGSGTKRFFDLTEERLRVSDDGENVSDEVDLNTMQRRIVRSELRASAKKKRNAEGWKSYIKELVAQLDPGVEPTIKNVVAVSHGEITEKGIRSLMNRHGFSYEDLGIKRERIIRKTREQWVVYIRELVSQLGPEFRPTLSNIAKATAGKVTAREMRTAMRKHDIPYTLVGIEKSGVGRPRDEDRRSELRAGKIDLRKTGFATVQKAVAGVGERNAQSVTAAIINGINMGRFNDTATLKAYLRQLPRLGVAINLARVDALADLFVFPPAAVTPAVKLDFAELAARPLPAYVSGDERLGVYVADDLLAADNDVVMVVNGLRKILGDQEMIDIVRRALGGEQVKAPAKFLEWFSQTYSANPVIAENRNESKLITPGEIAADKAFQNGAIEAFPVIAGWMLESLQGTQREILRKKIESWEKGQGGISGFLVNYLSMTGIIFPQYLLENPAPLLDVIKHEELHKLNNDKKEVLTAGYRAILNNVPVRTLLLGIYRNSLYGPRLAADIAILNTGEALDLFDEFFVQAMYFPLSNPEAIAKLRAMVDALEVTEPAVKKAMDEIRAGIPQLLLNVTQIKKQISARFPDTVAGKTFLLPEPVSPTLVEIESDFLKRTVTIDVAKESLLYALFGRGVLKVQTTDGKVLEIAAARAFLDEVVRDISDGRAKYKISIKERKAIFIKFRSEVRIAPKADAVRLATLVLAPGEVGRVAVAQISEDVISDLIAQYRENKEALRLKMLAQADVSRFDAVKAVMNDLDSGLDQISGASNRKFAIGLVLPEGRLDENFFAGFLSGLDKGAVGELLKDGRISEDFRRGLADYAIRVRDVHVEKTNAIETEQAEVPAALMGEKSRINEMFLPLFLNPKDLEALQRKNPEAARWFGKVVSRALIHLADLSQDSRFKGKPEALRDELLKRLNLFEQNYQELITLTQARGRLAFGVNTALAEALFEDKVSRMIGASA